MVCLWWIGVILLKVKDRWPRASLFSFSKTCRQTFPAHPPTYAQTTSYICGKTPTSELQIFKVLKPESLRNLLADLFSISLLRIKLHPKVYRVHGSKPVFCVTQTASVHIYCHWTLQSIINIPLNISLCVPETLVWDHTREVNVTGFWSEE